MAVKIMPEFKNKTPATAASKLNFKFTQIYLLLNLYITISNPNTHICDPDDAFLESTNNYLLSKPRYSNYNGIPCSSLLPSYHLQKHDLENKEQKQLHLHNNTNIPIYFENECISDNINDNDYLFALFHCNYNYNKQQRQVYSSKYNRYHTYYHYDLERERNSSLSTYLQSSCNRFWETIPSQWKFTTTCIGIVDAFLVIIIKYLVFEDNYPV